MLGALARKRVYSEAFRTGDHMDDAASREAPDKGAAVT
jgi:hypothetical protein